MATQSTTIIAVSVSDMKQWGCPHCGYRSGHMPLSANGSAIWECASMDCGRTCCVLADGLTKSSIGFGGKFYPELQDHPRRGIPAHGRPDTRPEGGGEFFSPRGIGLDDCTCFICGAHDRDGQGHTLLSNIAAFVKCKAAGERVVEMFQQGARLDYRDFEPDYVQVKVGACNTHLLNLEKLLELTRDGVITTEKIASAMA